MQTFAVPPRLGPLSMLPPWLTVADCAVCKRTVATLEIERSVLQRGSVLIARCHGLSWSYVLTDENQKQARAMILVPFGTTRDRLNGKWIWYTGLVPRGELVYVDAREDGSPRLTRPDGTVITLATGWERLDAVRACEMAPPCAPCGATIVGENWNFAAGIICGGDEPEASAACKARQEANSETPSRLVTGADFGETSVSLVTLMGATGASFSYPTGSAPSFDARGGFDAFSLSELQEQLMPAIRAGIMTSDSAAEVMFNERNRRRRSGEVMARKDVQDDSDLLLRLDLERMARTQRPPRQVAVDALEWKPGRRRFGR